MRFAKLFLLTLTIVGLGTAAFADTRRFIEPLRIDLNGKSHYATVVADFNGDGNLDIAATQNDPFKGGTTVDVALGTGTGFGPAASYTVGEFPQGIATADFNHDGKLDLVVASSTRKNTVSVLLGNGDGTFQPLIGFSLGGVGASNIVVADFNGDGNPDVALGKGRITTDISVVVLLGNGDGSFRTGPTLGHAGPALAAGDVNGDGKPDLVAGSGSSVLVFLGRGDGNFRHGVTYNTAGTTLALTLADFNHDGKLDIATSAYYRDLASVLLGNGDGTFQKHVDYGISTYSTSIAVADLDGDGNPDLIVGDAAFLSILFGKGDGTLRPQVLYGTGFSPTGITAADVTGDGKVDLLTTGNYDETYLRLLINTGFGKLRADPEYDAKNYAYALAEGDFNGDGKDDVIVSSRYLGGDIVTA
jgi:hypothetical protein